MLTFFEENYFHDHAIKIQTDSSYRPALQPFGFTRDKRADSSRCRQLMGLARGHS